ncbi:dde superfamily endonuclease [Holotrichia oblita]|uniref:Dde superfamily endonuclease n=1 Tax=Holotrichia oblita TaxID=644536 RepID=A0ACB9TDT4_HOLOL|nr:dde superfamily endonuclease [Holotrichia oblita]
MITAIVYILGDSAYPCKTYLMAPILHPANDGGTRYNNAQTKTRNCLERCFGIWKQRFSALAIGLRVSKQAALTAIVAAAVLQNLAVDEGLEVPEPEVAFLENVVLEEAANIIGDGNIHRQYLVRNYF